MCNSNSSASDVATSSGVASLAPQRPAIDLPGVVDSLDWLVPLGMAHLETLWDDEHTPPKVLERVEAYVASLAAPPDSHATAMNQSLKMSPAQILHLLDVAREAREEIEKEQFYRSIEDYLKHIEWEKEEKQKQEAQLYALRQSTAARLYT